VNAECTAEGNVFRAYTKVEYDAIIMGGNGGNSGCGGGGGGSEVDVGK
jgi:phosphoribosylformylglycinamidine (FGAM) synthase-like enzyme